MDISELRRLEALNAYNIMDSEPEQTFDDITRLTARLFSVPIALVSLVDERRQWFKSKVGVDLTETRREDSVCQYALTREVPLVVPDMQKDVVFHNHPLVTGAMSLRFYAGTPLRNAEGLVMGTLCIADVVPRELSPLQIDWLQILGRQIINLMEMRKTTAYLQVLSGRQKALIENLREGILVEDDRGHALTVSPRFCTMFDLPMIEDAVSATDWELNLHSISEQFEDQDAFTRRVESLRAGRCAAWDRLKTGDGRVLERNYIPIPGGERMAHLWTYLDVTREHDQEMIIAQQQLALTESAKLRALGEMAGGLAHEINNPLAVILGRTVHLRERSAQGPMGEADIVKFTDQILKITERVARTVRGLRNFARSDESDPMEPAAFSHLLEDTLEFCRERFRSMGVELRIEIPTDLPNVKCRPSQISQILLNLLNNAADAVEEAGQKWVSIAAAADAERVFVRISDGGPGVPPGHRQSLFNPFFTTKAPGKGTGMGLSISKRIAEDHGGTLDLERPEGPTTFMLTLPQG